MKIHWFPCITRFDEGGAPDAGAPAENTESKDAAVVYGKQGEESEQTDAGEKSVDRKAAFEELIKGEYRGEYRARTQAMISERFKASKAEAAKLQQAMDAQSAILEPLYKRYNVQPGDLQALQTAMDNDTAQYAQEAMEKGMDVEQVAALHRAERENAQLRRALESRSQQENAERQMATWNEQAAKCAAKFTDFDFEAELTDPVTGQQMVKLLQSGVDVTAAYQAIHMDDLLGGAVQYAAKAVKQQVVNDIRARGLRPTENGATGAGAAQIVKSDPSKWTKKDRDEVERRVMRGEVVPL